MKKIMTVYRTVRIDLEYDPARTDIDSAREQAVEKVFSDARAHIHTAENGVRITDITDCGENEVF